MRTMPTRVDDELFEAARAAGEESSRSAAQQIGHWARIGRQLEAAPATTLQAVNAVLAGRASYDALPDAAQAVVRGAWDEQIAARLAGLDFERELRSADESWTEADADGHLIVRGPGGQSA